MIRLDSGYEEGAVGESAINPLVVPAILTTFAIILAVVTASWMGGLSERYTTTESLEVRNVACALDGHGNWEVSLKIENCGRSTLTLSEVLVNDEEVKAYGAILPAETVDTITTDTEKDATPDITPGECAEVTIWIGAKQGSFKKGDVVEIKIRYSGDTELVEKVQLV